VCACAAAGRKRLQGRWQGCFEITNARKLSKQHQDRGKNALFSCTCPTSVHPPSPPSLPPSLLTSELSLKGMGEMCRKAAEDLIPPPPLPRLPAPAPDEAELGVLAALDAEALLLLLPPPPAGRPRLPPSDTIFCTRERAKKGRARRAAGAAVVNLCVWRVRRVWLGWWYEKGEQKQGDQSSKTTKHSPSNGGRLGMKGVAWHLRPAGGALFVWE